MDAGAAVAAATAAAASSMGDLDDDEGKSRWGASSSACPGRAAAITAMPLQHALKSSS
jgi:hypothetical protein